MNTIPGSQDALMLLAYRTEISLGMTKTCIKVGPGPHETRPEYLHVYEAFFLSWPNEGQGTVPSLLIPDNLVVAVIAAKAAIAAKVVAGTATLVEKAVAALPAPKLLSQLPIIGGLL